MSNGQASAISVKPATVLVVDDEPGIREVVSRALKSFGYECATASDGREALRCQESHPSDLIITDLEMPRMRGLEFIERLRANDSETPVIIMTAFADFDFAQRALQLGVSDYLVKPFDSLAEVQAAARRAIETRTIRSEPDALARELDRRLHGPGPRRQDHGVIDPTWPDGDAMSALAGAGPHFRACAQAAGDDGHVPQVVGGARILEKLGEGNMGAVYKAVQSSVNRLVAIKMLRPDLARNSEFVARFFREARIAARLDHPNIVRGLDAGIDAGVYYFVMEFVEGESVADILDAEGAFPEEKGLYVAIQMACALEHARTVGLVHRDVTPANILLTHEGTAKLADLGLARPTCVDSPALTGTSISVGTPLYMSPEQAMAEKDIDIRTDIYGLGATLYHMVVGAPPFTGPTPAAVLAMHLRDQPVPAHRRNDQVSIKTSSIIDKMLRKEPAARYAGPAQLAEDLVLVSRGLPPKHASLVG
jgi:CheY-like chemotaxis protein